MNTTLRRDADEIIRSSIQAVLPDKPVSGASMTFTPLCPQCTGRRGFFFVGNT